MCDDCKAVKLVSDGFFPGGVIDMKMYSSGIKNNSLYSLSLVFIFISYTLTCKFADNVL